MKPVSRLQPVKSQLQRIPPGSFIGEHTMLWGFPRRMTVDTVTDCVLGKLTSATCPGLAEHDSSCHVCFGALRLLALTCLGICSSILWSYCAQTKFQLQLKDIIVSDMNFLQLQLLCDLLFLNLRPVASLGADIDELPCPCRYFNVITRSAMAARSLKEKYLRKAAWKGITHDYRWRDVSCMGMQTCTDSYRHV